MKLKYFLFLVFASFFLSFAHAPNVISGKKSEHCLEIFNKLKATKGLLPDQAPFLALVRSLPNPNFAIAMASGSNIYLDEASYDECLQMGMDADNGLAFILAHELAHFTNKHIERHRFEEDNEQDQRAEIFDLMEMDDSINAKELSTSIEAINNKYEIRKNEAEADLEAGFMSYLAGYKSLNAGAVFLARAYDRFGLKKDGGNYASLAERQDIVRNATLQLDSLIQVFEAANFATVVGDEELALEGYTYVSKKFRSARLHNNLGVHLINKLSSIFDESDIPWVFPLTLDIELGDSDSDGIISYIDDPDEMARLERIRREEYFGKVKMADRAIAHFDKAIQLNSAYHSAHVNKSIALFFKYKIEKDFDSESEFLEDNLVFGIGEALKARIILSKHSESNNKAFSDVYNLMGVFAYYLREVEEARQLFDQAEAYYPKRYITHANRITDPENGDYGAMVIPDFELVEEEKNQEEAAAVVPVAQDIVGVNGQSLDEKLFDNLDLSKLLGQEESKWDMQKVIGIINPDSALPIRTVINYSNRKDHQLYSWVKKKGKSKVLKNLYFFSPKSNYNYPTSLGIKKSDSKDLLEVKYGYPANILETVNSTMYCYHSSLTDGGIVFLLKEGKVSNWIVWEKSYPN